MSIFGLTIITTKKYRKMQNSIRDTSQFIDSCIARLDEVLETKPEVKNEKNGTDI